MKNAKEAYAASGKSREEKIQKELNLVCAVIDKAIEKGEYEAKVFNKTLNSGTIEQLKKLGYKITFTHSGLTETDTIISWDQKDGNNDEGSED